MDQDHTHVTPVGEWNNSGPPTEFPAPLWLRLVRAIDRGVIVSIVLGGMFHTFIVMGYGEPVGTLFFMMFLYPILAAVYLTIQSTLLVIARRGIQWSERHLPGRVPCRPSWITRIVVYIVPFVLPAVDQLIYELSHPR